MMSRWSFSIFCLFFVIINVHCIDKINRRLKQQQQRQLSSTTVSSTNHNDHNWPSSHHQLETFAEDEEYFEELKPSGHSCEDIRIEICHGVGYNVTSMPNFVGHELQADAELQLQSFIPLISYGCSSQLKFFLCSVYVPMCTEKVPVMIGPCRPLCENVKSRCAPVLSELGFQWPSALNCSKFVPENTVDHMCMEGPPPHESELVPIMPTIMNHNSISNNGHPIHTMMAPPSSPIRHHHLNIDLKMPHQLHEIYYMNNRHGPEENNTMKSNVVQMSSQTPHTNPCLEYRHSENYVFLEHPRNRCVSQCQADVLFTVDNKNFVDYWTVVWSSISLLSCLFTLIIFVWTPQKFRYPERAIFYIALCYMIYALAYIYRALVGRNAVSCYQEGPNDHLWLLVQEGAHNPHCTISFLMLYYFGMAGNAWWLVLATSWSLSVAFGWSMQRLSYHSQLYHSLAWTLPALQTLSALVMRAVDADELTGICYVGSQDDAHLLKFVILPLTFYLGTGILFIIFSFISVRFGIHLLQTNYCCGAEDENNGSNVDTETDHNSSLHSDFVTIGCGDFCRRLRRNYSCNTNHSLRVSSGAGSGHSLLLLNNGQTTNFCSTVSSTSSYSSTASSNHYKRSSYTNQFSTNNRINQIVGNSDICQNHQLMATNNVHFNDNCTSLSYDHHRHNNRCITNGVGSTIFNTRRTPINDHHKNAALIRSGIFALFYTLPALCVLSTYIYEYLYRDQWLLRNKMIDSVRSTDISMISSATISNSDPNSITVESIEANRPNFEVFNMRLFMSLLIGIETGIWILTAKSPISALHCVFSRCMTKKVFGPHSDQMRTIPMRNNTSGSSSTRSNMEFNGQPNGIGSRAIIQQYQLNLNPEWINFPSQNVVTTSNIGDNFNDHLFFANDVANNNNNNNNNNRNKETTFQCVNGSTMSTTISSKLSNPLAPSPSVNIEQKKLVNNLILENPMIFGNNKNELEKQRLIRVGQQTFNHHRSGNETAV